jgi:hypothetical protein
MECFKLDFRCSWWGRFTLGFQGFDTDRWLPRFQRNILPAFSGTAAGSSKTDMSTSLHGVLTEDTTIWAPNALKTSNLICLLVNLLNCSYKDSYMAVSCVCVCVFLCIGACTPTFTRAHSSFPSWRLTFSSVDTVLAASNQCWLLGGAKKVKLCNQT